jgi:hypothetical protein
MNRATFNEPAAIAPPRTHATMKAPVLAGNSQHEIERPTSTKFSAVHWNQEDATRVSARAGAPIRKFRGLCVGAFQ